MITKVNPKFENEGENEDKLEKIKIIERKFEYYE
jgi:hypothetical protein